MAPPKMTSNPSSSTLSSSIQASIQSYKTNTTSHLKLVDSFLVFLMLSGVIQFGYCVLVTNFPYNAFLAGYVIFILSVFVEPWQCSLRFQAHFTRCKEGHTLMCFTCRFSSNVGQFVLCASLRSQVNGENKNVFKEVSPERYVLHSVL